MNTNPSQIRNRNTNYENINQTDPDRTRDEFLEEQERAKKRSEEFSSTNLFKARIISIIYIHTSI